MRQWFVRWEQELNRKLLSPAERERYYFEFNADGLMRGDAASRGQFYALMRQWGAYSANDVREKENETDLGPAGDVYLTPFNMANAEELLDGGGDTPQLVARQLLALMTEREQRILRPAPRALPLPAPHAEKRSLRLRRRIKAAQKPIIEDRAQMILNRETGAVEKILKAMLGQDGRGRRDLVTLRREIEEFYGEHAIWAAQRMQPVISSYGELVQGALADEIGQDADEPMPPEMQRFMKQYGQRFGAREASEGRLQLLALTEEGDHEEVAEALRARLAEWDEKRPGKIAVEESTRFMAAAAKVLYVSAGVTVLRWVANPGACPFCQSINGQVAGVQQNFVNAGQDVDGGEGTDGPLKPSDNIGHPPLHSNCECDIVAA
jgi:hypothetical protein